MKKVLFLLLFIVLQTMDSIGQVNDTTKLRIETTDGNVFIGNVTSESEEMVLLRTDNLGIITIMKTDIKSRTAVGNLKKVGKEFWLPNPQSTRYFWAPNGYGLEEGEAYYQNIWIFYNQVSFGIADNFSLGAGMMPLFLFGGAPTPVWIVPKFSIPVIADKFNVGTGAFLGTVIGEDTGIFGLLYGTGTIGSRDKNMSLGLAYGFARDGWMKLPLINLSGMVRTGPRGYFITENYIISTGDETIVFISAGGRSMLRKVGLDYSLWLPFAGQGTVIIAPFLGITVSLGKNP